MIQEEKDLLLKVLCAMLPYGVIVYHPDYDEPGTLDTIFTPDAWNEGGIRCTIDDNWDSPHEIKYCKPYLRPMSSITDEELSDLWVALDKDMDMIMNNLDAKIISIYKGRVYRGNPIHHELDFLNAHHFDYQGLIEKGLALEASEGMYN